nr:hypothetical protein [Eubacterium sp.]
VAKKTKYKDEWRKKVYYDKNGYETRRTMKWKQNAVGWWVSVNDGTYLRNCWQKIDGVWYYFKADGYMASKEWCKGYWLDKNGAWTYKPKASWHSNKKGWWYQDTSGWYAKSSWQKIDGKWYYFDAKGYMVTNQKVGQYWVGADGARK